MKANPLFFWLLLVVVFIHSACSNEVTELSQEINANEESWKSDLGPRSLELQINDFVHNHWQEGKPGVITKNSFPVEDKRRHRAIGLAFNQVKRQFTNPATDWPEVVAWAEAHLTTMSADWQMEMEYSGEIQSLLLRVIDDYLIYATDDAAKAKTEEYLDRLLLHNAIDVRVLGAGIFSLSAVEIGEEKYVHYLNMLREKVDEKIEGFPGYVERVRHKIEEEEDPFYQSIHLRGLALQRDAYQQALAVREQLDRLSTQ